MKRTLIAILYLVLIFLLVFSGCQNAAPGTAPVPAPQPSVSSTGPKAASGPVFTISDLMIVPSEVKMRDGVNISVLVTNSGDTTGSYTVNLEINGEAISSKEITLTPGASDAVSFKTSREVPGDYLVDVNSNTGKFTVIPPPSAPDNPPVTPDNPPAVPSDQTAPPVQTAWTIPTGSGTNLRAVHMGGNWGTNRTSVVHPPEEYFMYLRDLNVNWVGISVALHIDGSMDSTVELNYNEALQIPTFKDETLRNLIKIFRKHGFNVYIHVAFEGGNSGEHPHNRWQLGDPLMHTEDPNIKAEFWPWRTDYPQHQAFIAEFWQTYTNCMVHIAQIAEEEGVGALTMGTETDRLFRSRSGGRWTNNFLPQMQNMVSAVRAVYHGLLSYEMHYQAITNNYFDAGSDYLVKDLGLDFIAVSAYFELWPNTPAIVPSVPDLEASWNAVFNEQLKPLRDNNNNKPIIFTEFGYVDLMSALHNAADGEFSAKNFQDNDGNGKDDGEEAQSNAYAALFNTMDKYPGMVEGTFLWDVMMATAQEYRQSFFKQRTFNIRLKLAEAMVRERYAGWCQ